jgi:hypothetical protein
MSAGISRRDLIRGAIGLSATAALSPAAKAASPRPRRLADVGWCWDGQGLNGQWRFSIFGAGEGTKWFGLQRTCFMFHPNTVMAMDKLRDMGIKEVVCDISKWECQKVEHPDYKGLATRHDGRRGDQRTAGRKIHPFSETRPFTFSGRLVSSAPICEDR